MRRCTFELKQVKSHVTLTANKQKTILEHIIIHKPLSFEKLRQKTIIFPAQTTDKT